MTVSKPRKASTQAEGDAAPTKQREPALFVRISPELDADLDAWLEELRVQHPGFSVSKADLVRDVLIRAVGGRKAAPKS